MSAGSELKRIRGENNNVSVQKIAAKIGVDAERWRKWEAKDLNPREEDQLKIEKFFGVDIQELNKIHKVKFSSKNVPERLNSLEMHEDQTEYQKGDNKSNALNTSKDRAMDTLYSLAESNKILVATNAELAGMLKSVFYKTTAGADQGNPSDVLSKLDTLLEVIAEVGSGKKWRSKQEAIATLGKRFYADSGT